MDNETKTILFYFFIEHINTCYFLDKSIDIKGCIRQFNCFWIPDHLQSIGLNNNKLSRLLKNSEPYNSNLLLIKFEKNNLVLYSEFLFLQICQSSKKLI